MKKITSIKKKRALIIACVAAVLVAGLCIWRFWPLPASSCISVDGQSVTCFSATAMLRSSRDGQRQTDTYSIVNTQPQGRESADILEILATSEYRQDFQNLLPWHADIMESDKNYDGRTVVMVFSVGNQKDEWVQIHYLSKSVISVSAGDREGFRIYHPTNPETLDALVEYFEAHGTKG